VTALWLAGDATSVKSANGHDIRPDIRPDVVVRDRDGIRMLLKGENKAANLMAAKGGLVRKTQGWTSLYYGQLQVRVVQPAGTAVLTNSCAFCSG
jgi:hypothetical protein